MTLLTKIVQIHQTDCYGVMWHGAYHAWLEEGRVALLDSKGIPRHSPGCNENSDGLVYPVIEQTLQYKSSPRLWDALTLDTQVSRDKLRLIFNQTVYNTTQDKIAITAKTVVLVLSYQHWKPLRHWPPYLNNALDTQKVDID